MYRENWKRPNTFVHCLCTLLSQTLIVISTVFESDNGEQLITKLYDKHDDFTSPIVNIPSASQTHSVYISQLICFSRTCAQQNLLKQVYVAPRLKSLLQK